MICESLSGLKELQNFVHLAEQQVLDLSKYSMYSVDNLHTVRRVWSGHKPLERRKTAPKATK